MEDINLHFTGDFHAVSIAHNLLAALVDNHIYFGNTLGFDIRRPGVAPRARHERPQLAPHRQRLGRHGQWLPARDGLRHRRRVRGHGDPLLVDVARRHAQPLQADHRRLHARQQADSCRGAERAGLDDGAHEGSAQAEPRAVARADADARARRPVREHRARLQLRDRDEDGAQARRLRRHGSRLRRGPGRREVRRHQVPQVGPAPVAPRCSSARRAR